MASVMEQAIHNMTGMEKIEEFLKEQRNYDGLGMWKEWMMKELQ